MFTNTINNPNFQNIAALIRVPFKRRAWRNNHEQVPFKILNEKISKAVFVKETPLNKEQTLAAFIDMLTSISNADPLLSYKKEDIDWLVNVIESEDAKSTLALLCAYYTASDSFITPAEIAEQTNTAESGWRNRAAAGEFPSAYKAGKTWLIPVGILRSRGYNVIATIEETDED